MKGKVYKFIDPKTGKVEYVREENLGFAGEKSFEDYLKKYGHKVRGTEIRSFSKLGGDDLSVDPSDIPPEILKKLEEEEELGL